MLENKMSLMINAIHNSVLENFTGTYLPWIRKVITAQYIVHIKLAAK